MKRHCSNRFSSDVLGTSVTPHSEYYMLITVDTKHVRSFQSKASINLHLLSFIRNLNRSSDAFSLSVCVGKGCGRELVLIAIGSMPAQPGADYLYSRTSCERPSAFMTPICRPLTWSVYSVMVYVIWVEALS